jgi:hypothetical protein
MSMACFLLGFLPMNTLAALKQYDVLCDELDSYMREENAHLRNNGSDEEILVGRKRQILEKLNGALVFLRDAGPVRSAEHAASGEVRKRVLAKILKLLLLSRESEQLLLKNSLRAAPRMATPVPTPNRLANAYKTNKSASAPTASKSQAEGNWAVW